MATANTGGGTPPPPANNAPSMTGPTGTAITWVIRIILLFVLLLLLKGGCNKSEEKKDEDKKENTKTVEMLNPKGEFICYPGSELTLPPIEFTGGVKVRVNGHDHFVYYPSIKEWQFRSKKIEQYNSPLVNYGDVIKLKADTTEKEPFTVYLYQITEVEIHK